MNAHSLLQILNNPNVKVYDCMFNTDAITNNGWKLSIQGKSVSDAMVLYNSLSEYLFSNNIPFKVATQKRIRLSNKVQACKVMTIYIPNDVNRYELAESIYEHILHYKGWQNIRHIRHGLVGYECYAAGIFMRNDRDVHGNYIPAQQSK